MPDTNHLPVGLGSTTLAEGAESTTAERLEQAGLALGELVKSVGNAVAATQRQMNETCAATANALATTMVDIVAVRHKEYEDDGSLSDTGNLSHKMPLPLVNFVDPVNYEMTRVHLQGLFYASDFRSASASSVDTSSAAGSGHLYLGGVFSSPALSGGLSSVAAAAQTGTGADYAYGSQSTTSSQTGTASQQQYDYGTIRMNAEMTPRTDIGVPKPNHVIRGPSVLLVAQNVRQVPTTVTPDAPLQERSSIIHLTFRRRPTAAKPEGELIPGAGFTIEASGLTWEYCDAAGTVDESETSALRTTHEETGDLYFVVRRRFEPGADTAPRSFVVTARRGLLQTSIAVSL